MEADPSLVGPEGLILIYELRDAYEAPEDPSKCSPILLPSFQEEGAYSYYRFYDERADAESREAYQQFKCWKFKRFDDTSKEKAAALRHTRAGYALSDYYCDNFFRRISRRTSERRFGRSATNDVGAAISAILGFAKAGSNVVGGVATGFGLADGVIRAYDEIFTISPDLGNIQSLVKDKHKTLWGDLATKPPTDYFEANSAIISYANYCSFVGMKDLLDEKLTGATEIKDSQKRLDDALVIAATAQDRRDALIAGEKRKLAEQKLKDKEAEAAVNKKIKDLEKPAAKADGPTPAAGLGT